MYNTDSAHEELFMEPYQKHTSTIKTAHMKSRSWIHTKKTHVHKIQHT